MTVASSCPRCSGQLRAPGLMSSTWDCASHGAVLPYRHVPVTAARRVADEAKVPLWFPHPLLPGWLLTGLATVGDERSGDVAVAVAMSGPSPLGGPADMVLVAEEPGTGLGGHLAGSGALDPGECFDGAPDAKLLVAGHPTPLWSCTSADDRVAYAGEAGGVWLWAVLWPPPAELLLMEHVELHDLRHESHAALDLPAGAPTTRLP